MRAPAITTGWQVFQQAVCQKGGIAVLCLIQRRRIRPITNRDIQIIASRHIIAHGRKVASPGAAVVKPKFQRLNKAVHHLFIGCQDRVIGSMVTRVGGSVGIAIQ